MGILQDDVAEDVGSVPSCQTCNSERVVRSAQACWNSESGLWELETLLETDFCNQCANETTLRWARSKVIVCRRVRELNDLFRTSGEGIGSIVVTHGLHALGDELVLKALLAVQAFEDFSEDNDPWGEHDFGATEVDDQKVFWKIDYYDPDLQAGSENPANQAKTHRVLTIKLASEY